MPPRAAVPPFPSVGRRFLFLTCFLRFFYNKHFFPMYSLKCPEKFAQLMW